MRSTVTPPATLRRNPTFRLLCATAFALATTACAGRSLVAEPAPGVQLNQPSFTREPCAVTATPVQSIADLETRDRARGVDVAACDAKRALAVQVHDEEHRLEAEQAKVRAGRNAWACRTLGWFCPN